jgi:hypothetical protein
MRIRFQYLRVLDVLYLCRLSSGAGCEIGSANLSGASCNI